MSNPLSKLKMIRADMYEVWMRTYSNNYLNLIKRFYVNGAEYLSHRDIYFDSKEKALNICRREFKKDLILSIKENKKETRFYVKLVNRDVKLLNKYYK